MYKCILFDMDGTLVNSYEGIYNSYEYAFKKMNIEFKGKEFVENAIGAPLILTLENLCNMKKDEILKAVEYYRNYYNEKGKSQVKAYNGIKETLEKLKNNGYLLGVATLKRENFAKEILKNLNLLSNFDIVCGMDEKDSLTKADIIKNCISELNIKKEEAILVGDSEFDLKGAKEAGVDFLALTYGFGFRDREKLNKFNIEIFAENAYEISEKISLMEERRLKE